MYTGIVMEAIPAERKMQQLEGGAVCSVTAGIYNLIKSDNIHAEIFGFICKKDINGRLAVGQIWPATFILCRMGEHAPTTVFLSHFIKPFK